MSSKIWRSKSGFSLMEITVSLAILGLVASMSAPLVLRKIVAARVETTQQEMIQIKEAVEQYIIDNFNSAPTGTIEAVILSLVSQNYLEANFSSSADQKLITDWETDGWGVPYEYVAPTDSESGSLTSYGPNKSVAFIGLLMHSWLYGQVALAAGMPGEESDDIVIVIPKIGD